MAIIRNLCVATNVMRSMIEDAQGIEHKFFEKFLEIKEGETTTRKLVRAKFEEWAEADGVQVRQSDVSRLYKILTYEYGCVEDRGRQTNRETVIYGCKIKEV